MFIRRRVYIEFLSPSQVKFVSRTHNKVIDLSDFKNFDEIDLVTLKKFEPQGRPGFCGIIAKDHEDDCGIWVYARSEADKHIYIGYVNAKESNKKTLEATVSED